jgi:hypothetical protein
VLDGLDALNRDDPHVVSIDGRPHPYEVLYAGWVTAWVLRLDPAAGEPLRIAARGQHVRRWTVPRATYPAGRRGYLQWREALKTFHAETVAGLMAEAGYAADAIDRVRRLMSKRELSEDADTQTLEDALCLVFLERQFADLRAKTAPETMAQVLRKTWGKMSPAARRAALALPLAAGERAALEAALKG